MNYEVDVVIIGAGTAGLYALSQVIQKRKSYLVVQNGKMGTTCARVGCMPSKVLIQAAEDFHRRKLLEREGIDGGEGLSVDGEEVMEFVRELRDNFVERVHGNNDKRLKDHIIHGQAEFVEPGTLRVGDDTVSYKSVVISSGTSPVVPGPWQAFADRIITTDSLFEQDELPESIAVIGLGVIGLEIGQALARLGVAVTGVEMAESVGGVDDPEILDSVVETIGREFPVWLGQPAEVVAEQTDEGEKLRVTAGENSVLVDKLLVSMGRKPNLEGMKLENLGLKLNDRDTLDHDINTMQVGDLPVFLAGDVSGNRAIMHEAGDEGRIAGINAASDAVVAYRRKTPLAITFTDPNICMVGKTWSELDHENTAVGQVKMAPVGRALIMTKNRGLIRVYGDSKTGKLLGASLFCVKGENLAHLLAWCIQQELTVFDLLRMPFYHPVIEEALQAALRDLAAKVENRPSGILDIEKL
jgi:dihydrolipoamide dehydrogenase